MEVENYVSFNIAQLLKEKGFDEPCDFVYDGDKLEWIYSKFVFLDGKISTNSEFYDSEIISAPTLQETIKWLRKVYHIEILITCGFPSIDGVCQFKYFWHVVKVNLCDKRLEYPMDCLERVADTFESACDSAIEFCLTNLI